MINIWKFTIGDRIKIKADNDIIFTGIVEAITDVEERSDLERQEDGIYIITEDGRHIEIYESEIKEISKIEGYADMPAFRYAI